MRLKRNRRVMLKVLLRVLPRRVALMMWMRQVLCRKAKSLVSWQVIVGSFVHQSAAVRSCPEGEYVESSLNLLDVRFSAYFRLDCRLDLPRGLCEHRLHGREEVMMD